MSNVMSEVIPGLLLFILVVMIVMSYFTDKGMKYQKIFGWTLVALMIMGAIFK